MPRRIDQAPAPARPTALGVSRPVFSGDLMPSAFGNARFAWLDNLRVTVITCVIVVHVGLVYAVEFDWFYEERTAHVVTKALLSLLFGPAFLFGMAVLFFVAGIGGHRSLERKGARRFLRDRLVRLGLPLVAIIVVLEPLTQLIGSRAEGEPAAADAWGFFVDELRTPETGHGWFIAALLVFSMVHIAWRRRHRASESTSPFGRREAVIAWLALVGATFLVRLAWPVAEETPLALLFWEWPQMATLYALGVSAGERHWLDPMPDRLKRTAAHAAAAGVGGAVLLSAAVFFSEDGGSFLGGADPRALAYPAVEATLAIAMSFWLLGWFHEKWNQDGPFARAVSRASFGAYVIHLPLVVWLSAMIRSVDVPAELKFVVVSVVGVSASFGIAWLVGRIRLNPSHPLLETDSPRTASPSVR